MALEAGDAVARSNALREPPKRRDTHGVVLIFPSEPRADLEGAGEPAYSWDVLVVLRTRVHRHSVPPRNWRNQNRGGSRLMQILSNLLSNAHKYTPNEGHIDLSVEIAEPVARVKVTDSGIGLSTEEQAQLFTRFYRRTTL